jgi:hypothetical protein
LNNDEKQKYYVYLYEEKDGQTRLILGMNDDVRTAIINNMVGNYWCDDMLYPERSRFYSAGAIRVLIKRGFRLV